MFEEAKARREFLASLRSGKVTAQAYQQALNEAAFFKDCRLDDVAWTFQQQNPQIQKLGSILWSASRHAESIDRVMASYQQETEASKEKHWLNLLALAWPEAVLNRLAQWVNQGSVHQRRKALRLFLKLKVWPAQRALVTAFLEDPDPWISENTVKAVAQAAPRAFLRIIRKLAFHSKEDVRKACLSALMGINTPEEAHVVLLRMPHESKALQQPMAQAVIQAIKQHPEAMTQVLLKTLVHGDQAVRHAAMDLFSKLPHRSQAFQHLLRYAESLTADVANDLFAETRRYADHFAKLVAEAYQNQPDTSTRMLLLRFAAALKHPSLAGLFLTEARSDDWMVRYLAIKTLGEMKVEKALPMLVEALKDDMAAGVAIQALAEFKDPRTIQPMLQALPAAGETQQVALVQTLGQFEEPKLLSPLARFLDSPAPKGKAKRITAETVLKLCETTHTPIPERIREIHAQCREATLDDLPDLGLKLAD